MTLAIARRSLDTAENNLRAATGHSRTAHCMNEVARWRRIVRSFATQS